MHRGLQNPGSRLMLISLRQNPQPILADRNPSGAPAPHHDGAIFVPVSYGDRAWNAFGHAGFRSVRSANPRTVAPIFDAWRHPGVTLNRTESYLWQVACRP